MQHHTPDLLRLGQRISVVGCSGAGKTTLVHQLAQRLGYRHVELDALFHQPGWQPLPEAEFRSRVADALQGERWIVEGNYSVVRSLTLERVDTVIWLDLPRAQVMRQVIRRTLSRALLRKTLWNGNRERWSNLYSLDPRKSIIAWSWTRYHLYRQRYGSEAAHPDNAHVRFIRLRSRADIQRLLDLTARAASPY